MKLLMKDGAFVMLPNGTLATDLCCDPCDPCNCSGSGGGGVPVFCSPCNRELNGALCVTLSNFTGDMSAIPDFSFLITNPTAIPPGDWSASVPNATYQACLPAAQWAPWNFGFTCSNVNFGVGPDCSCLLIGPNPSTGPYSVCVPIPGLSSATSFTVDSGPPFVLRASVSVTSAVHTCLVTNPVSATFDITISEDLTACGL